MLSKIKQNKYNMALLVVLFGLLTWVHYRFFPLALSFDWTDFFWPAGRAVLQGKSPYTVEGFFNPPWAALFLSVFSIFPLKLSLAVMTTAALLALTYTAYKLGAKPAAIIVLLLSAPLIQGIMHGNIDWLVVIGFVLPPQIGLFFISIKPQIGSAVALFWLVEAWRNGGWKEVLKVFGPFTLVLLLSFAVFGLWPLNFDSVNYHANASLWPQSIPIGLALMATALKKREIKYAIGASPFLAPYVMGASWIVVLLAIIASLPELIAAAIGIWIYLLLL